MPGVFSPCILCKLDKDTLIILAAVDTTRTSIATLIV